LGLREALRTLAFEFEDKYRCPVTFHMRGRLRHLPDAVAVTLFRVAQEALINVACHSQAQAVALSVVGDATCVTLIVMDDGQGFPVPPRLSALTKENHFGLLGMAERLELLGGTLAVQSEPGQGTTIQAWLPVASP
jgi:signal transduction histidine kinase